MKSAMKNFITGKSIPVLTLVLLVVLGSVLAGDAATTPLSALSCTITYNFAGHLGTIDDEGRLLAWDGEIHGDVEGVIKWWFDLTHSRNIEQVSHYVARWEIYDSAGNLILAGDDAGTTAKPSGEDGIWRGKGIVTEASAQFEDWIGRQIYDGGNVTWDENGVPVDGEGTFRIVPIADFNGDGKIDAADISIMAGHWNTGEPVCDIGPTPLGDGTVNAQDLLVLARHLAGAVVDVEADIAAIEEVLNQYAVTANAGDFEGWLSLHAEDVVKMPPGEPAIFGKEDLRANFAPGFDAFNLTCVIRPEETQVDGDMGFARGTYSISATPKAGGETTDLMKDGKYLTICKRQADGSWKIFHDCYNSNIPPLQ